MMQNVRIDHLIELEHAGVETDEVLVEIREFFWWQTCRQQWCDTPRILIPSCNN